jgi:hypothetical protein
MSSNYDKLPLKLLDKIREELLIIGMSCSEYQVKEKILNLIDLIENETSNNRMILIDMIYSKVRETKGRNSDLNARFYMLYRNLNEEKISIQEAQDIYDMYVKELDNIWLT